MEDMLEKKKKLEKVYESFFGENINKEVSTTVTPIIEEPTIHTLPEEPVKKKKDVKKLSNKSAYYSNEELEILRSNKYIRAISNDKYSRIYFTDSFYAKALFHLYTGGKMEDIEEMFGFPKFLAENRKVPEYIKRTLKSITADNKALGIGLPSNRWTDDYFLEKFNNILFSNCTMEELFLDKGTYITADKLVDKITGETPFQFPPSLPYSDKICIYSHLFYLYEQGYLDIKLNEDSNRVMYALNSKGEEYFKTIKSTKVPKKIDRRVVIEKVRKLRGVFNVLDYRNGCNIALRAEFKEYMYNTCFNEFLNNNEVKMEGSIAAYLIRFETELEDTCDVTTEELSILDEVLTEKYTYVLFSGREYPSLESMGKYLKKRDTLLNRVIAALYTLDIVSYTSEEDIIEDIKETSIFRNYQLYIEQNYQLYIEDELFQIALYECYLNKYLRRKLVETDSDYKYKDITYKNAKELSKCAKKKEIAKYFEEEKEGILDKVFSKIRNVLNINPVENKAPKNIAWMQQGKIDNVNAQWEC